MRRHDILFVLTVAACLSEATQQRVEGSSNSVPVKRCSNTNVAVLIPAKPDLHNELKIKMLDNARNMLEGNTSMCVHVFVDAGPLKKQPEDERPLSKTARLRNRMIDSLDLSQWDYILWIDADVVEYPVGLPWMLIKDNPSGVSIRSPDPPLSLEVTAPLVLIEEPGPDGPDQFYDTTAFTLKGTSHLFKDNNIPYVAGRSIEKFHPWVPNSSGDLVDVDGVGTVYIIPSRVYQSGARYKDDKRLTEHWSVIKQAHEMGLPVKLHRGLSVRHANLPKYGESWHGNSNESP